jgi:orotate phosphoribosyltransferase
MTYTEAQEEVTPRNWENEFARHGAYWRHDGNPKRPYARLTSRNDEQGHISNAYVDCTRVTSRAYVVKAAVEDLIKKRMHTIGNHKDVDAIAAPAMGAVSLAVLLGCHYQVPHYFAHKHEHEQGGMILDKRYALRSERLIVIAEDVITSGTSVKETVAALRSAAGYHINVPYIYALVNRSGKTMLDGIRIVSLIDIDPKDAPTWREGHNPFTPNGKEMVEPLKPKDKSNWVLLTMPY